MAAEQFWSGRVQWVDTDAGGRIHFTAAFRWAEAAETALMRRIGLLEGWADYPRKHVEAQFHRVLRFEDEFDVRLRVESVGRTSITYVWTIEKAGEKAIEGRHTVVHVDADGTPDPVPDAIRASLESSESGA